MHFDASGPFMKMMMDLISSANAFSIVYGICDYLGEINQTDL